jgi:hypothetical protein
LSIEKGGVSALPQLQEMADQATALRTNAEACRRLADLADDPLQKSLWGERADNWDALAQKA